MTRRTQSQWRELFERQKSSGLNAAEFYRQHELNPKYFSTRKRQLDGSGLRSTFIKAKPRVEHLPSESSDVRIRLLGLTVPTDQLASVLSDLMR